MQQQAISSTAGSDRFAHTELGAETLIPFVEPFDSAQLAELLAERPVYIYRNAATCPDCGAGMVRLGVCCACPSCGYESCSL